MYSQVKMIGKNPPTIYNVQKCIEQLFSVLKTGY